MLVGHTTVQMESSLRDVHTLSQKQVEEAREGNSEINLSEWCFKSAYRGTLEGEPVVVLVLRPYRNVAGMASQMQGFSLSHRHVAKVVGWCRDSRSIVVEGGKGGSLRDRIEEGLGWWDCCRIANKVALAVLYLERRGIGAIVSSEIIFFDDKGSSKLVYLPSHSKNSCVRFGEMLREMLMGPLLVKNVTSQADLKAKLNPRVKECPNDAIEELTRLTAACLEGDVTSMERVVDDMDRISKMASAAEQVNTRLRRLLTLAQKQMGEALDGPYSDKWPAYKGTVEGAPIVILFLESPDNVAAMEWHMRNLNHPHVAKILGWCRENRSIVVEGGVGGSFKDRIKQGGLGWQDCCRIVNQVALAVLYFERRGIDVTIDSELIFFDNTDNNKIVYRPSRSGSGHTCYLFGVMLREMLMGPLLDENVTSQAGLKAELDPRVDGWPKDTIDELTRLTAACLQSEFTSMEKVAKDMDRISKMSVVAKQVVNAFSEDIRLITAEEIAIATANFSSSNRIGKGGFGEVFKGRHKGMAIAVKRLLPGKANNRFEQEIQLLHKLRHPHILSLIGYEPSGPCLVSDYMSGGSLQDYLGKNGGALTWEDKVRISREMASAVAYMHGQGVVHRDLKPVNVLLDHGKRSKICDMGLAKLCEGNQVTMSGLHGTAGFMDPHTLQTGLVGPHSDTYALGLMILQLLTGLEHIRDVHNLLSQHEKQVTTEFSLKMESFTEDSTTVEILIEQSSSSTGSRETLATPSMSRWEEDPGAFNEIIEHFCLKFDSRSSGMPKVALQLTLGLLLRCLERTWEYRPNIDVLLSSLEELEIFTSKMDAEQSDLSAVAAEGNVVDERRRRRRQRRRRLEKSASLMTELEILVARRDVLRQDLVTMQDSAGKSKKRLSEVEHNISIAEGSQKIGLITRLGKDLKHLGQAIAAEEEKKLNLLSELEAVENDILEKERMAARLGTCRGQIAEMMKKQMSRRKSIC